MTWPYCAPSPQEIAERQRRNDAHDEKIRAAQEKLKRLEQEVRSFPGEKYLPNAARRTLQKVVHSRSVEAVDEARVAYQWAVYDKGSPRRPLYPRHRALSPSNKSFRKDRQAFFSQEESPLFNRLPPEIRAEVYRAVFGNLIIEIEAAHGGFNGPPPSKEYRVYFGSRITDWGTGGKWKRGSLYSVPDKPTFTPHIIPLLQTCRRIYSEAIVILYAESVLKYHGHHNSMECTKYLRIERLHTIRTLHFHWSLGYPWTAPTHRIAMDAFAAMKSLQKLCILGCADGLIDCTGMKLIDEALWNEKKDIFIPLFRKFKFIRDVDVFLPIIKDVLLKAGDERIGNVRLHGLTEEEAEGKKDVYCACEHMPEKMEIRQKALL